MIQRNLDLGRKWRDVGIKQAMETAETASLGWCERARNHLRYYMNVHGGAFMCEDVRRWAIANGCPKPPSLRAWGGIMTGALKAGEIKKVGYSQVTNPRAHRANAVMWMRNE